MGEFTCAGVAADRYLFLSGGSGITPLMSMSRALHDLGEARDVGRFVLRHAGAGGEPAKFNTRDYDLQVSTNGTTWTTVSAVRANTADVSTHAVTPVSARYVRVNILDPTQDSDPAARIYEFEVYPS